MEINIISEEEFETLETEVSELEGRQEESERRIDDIEYDMESMRNRVAYESDVKDVESDIETLLEFLQHQGIVPPDVWECAGLRKIMREEKEEANSSPDVEDEAEYKLESWSEADDTSSKYTVWVGGTEVNADYVEYDEACSIAKKYIDEGYDDVIVQLIKRRV